MPNNNAAPDKEDAAGTQVVRPASSPSRKSSLAWLKPKRHTSDVKETRRGDASPHTPKARRLLLFMWAVTVAMPWLLQIRCFSELVMRHKITQNLMLSAMAVKITQNVMDHCQVYGLHVAGTWWNTNPTHYYVSDNPADDGVLCHHIMPQYNIHGAYHIQKRKIAPVFTAPLTCVNDSYAANYFYYHGSIGYYSFYEEGEGSYCNQDHTVYLISTGVGSSDINIESLVKFKMIPGTVCHGLQETISLSNAVIFIQQAARIAPHDANNWHRLALLYLLVEGLMADLFLLIAREGYAAKVQYISLGYNIAGVLSMLFKIIESSKLLRPPWLLLVKRLLFNTELTTWGELLFSLAMQHYLTALNKSSLRESGGVAEAVSHYVWSLVSHEVVVLGQTTFILTVRAVGSIVFVLWRFRSLRVLVGPCCVDIAMGSRNKLLTLSGYVYHNSRLCYSTETLKALGR